MNYRTDPEGLTCGEKPSPSGQLVMEHVFTGNGTCVCGGAGLMRFSEEGEVVAFEDMPSAPPMARIRRLVRFVQQMRHDEAEARNVAMTAQESWQLARTRLDSAERLSTRLLSELVAEDD